LRTQAELSGRVVTESENVIFLVQNQGVTTATGHLDRFLLHSKVKDQLSGCSQDLNLGRLLGALAKFIVAPQVNIAIRIKGGTMLFASTNIYELFCFEKR